ncbi:MAG: helix-turn-helix domain-containing protein [Alphaproteobacteria bacterium]|nr:helix-turn-helix domain-containing protein [Alphaproteobacteria bacterium]
MPRNSQLMAAPPYEVERAIRTLGANLALARKRRGLSHSDVADKIGTTRFLVAAAEAGKPSTAIAVYAAMLWALGLDGQITEVAAPERDKEGLRLEIVRGPKRVRGRTPGR